MSRRTRVAAAYGKADSNPGHVKGNRNLLPLEGLRRTEAGVVPLEGLRVMVQCKAPGAWRPRDLISDGGDFAWFLAGHVEGPVAWTLNAFGQVVYAGHNKAEPNIWEVEAPDMRQWAGEVAEALHEVYLRRDQIVSADDRLFYALSVMVGNTQDAASVSLLLFHVPAVDHPCVVALLRLLHPFFEACEEVPWATGDGSEGRAGEGWIWRLLRPQWEGWGGLA